MKGDIKSGEKIDRDTLEDEARESTLTGHGTPADRFWKRQQGQAETIKMGKMYIAKVSSFLSGDMDFACANTKQAAPKESKKEL